MVSGERQRACVNVSSVPSVLPSLTNRNSTQCPFARNWLHARVSRRRASLKHGTTMIVCGTRRGEGPELKGVAISASGGMDQPHGEDGTCRDDSLSGAKATRLVCSVYIRYISRVSNRRRTTPASVQQQLPMEELRR